MVKAILIGSSYEKRPLYVLKVHCTCLLLISVYVGLHIITSLSSSSFIVDCFLSSCQERRKLTRKQCGSTVAFTLESGFPLLSACGLCSMSVHHAPLTPPYLTKKSWNIAIIYNTTVSSNPARFLNDSLSTVFRSLQAESRHNPNVKHTGHLYPPGDES